MYRFFPLCISYALSPPISSALLGHCKPHQNPNGSFESLQQGGREGMCVCTQDADEQQSQLNATVFFFHHGSTLGPFMSLPGKCCGLRLTGIGIEGHLCPYLHRSLLVDLCKCLMKVSSVAQFCRYPEEGFCGGQMPTCLVLWWNVSWHWVENTVGKLCVRGVTVCHPPPRNGLGWRGSALLRASVANKKSFIFPKGSGSIKIV